jgi:hypothetical protein
VSKIDFGLTFLGPQLKLLLSEIRLSIGIGLIMATTLENNGATVYIVGRRFDVLEKAAQDNNVRTPSDLISCQ